jgi:squalene-hopene/tetraprenyl-beta-curcumene cyclase
MFQARLDWMLTFQCKDGGWGAFDKDCTKSILEKVPFADHNAMLDPECADITARILELLGYEGRPWTIRRSSRAIDYIRAQQEPDGSWYGRWGVNYIYGTWQVLRGLRASGMDMNQPWLLRPATGSKASSIPTAAGANAAIPTTIPSSKAAAQHRLSNRLGRHGPLRLRRSRPPQPRRGIEYLVRTQNPDGSWTEHETTGTGFPKVFYLKYDMYRNTWPLLALATYHPPTPNQRRCRRYGVLRSPRNRTHTPTPLRHRPRHL